MLRGKNFISFKRGVSMLSKHWIALGAFFAFLAVLLGAFGSHMLKNMIDEKSLSIYAIGIHYHFVHALALIGFGLWLGQNPQARSQVAGWAFSFGIVLFSGSLYVLAITQWKSVGMVTPLGGVAFLAGWSSFFWAILK